MVTAKSTEMFFPTFIWLFDLEPDERDEINRTILDTLARLTENLPEILPGGGRQTDAYLHRLPEMAPFVEHVMQASTEVLDFLDVVYDGIQITGCWANISAVGKHHPEHIHPNNYVSGVYHVQADPGANTLTIEDPRPQRFMIRPGVKQSTTCNALQHRLTVGPGSMTLFPSWLPHSVDRNESQRERISVAFNLMFDDYANIMSPPEWRGEVLTGGKGLGS